MTDRSIWSCDERPGTCRNAHGCHCDEIANLLIRARAAEARSTKLEEALQEALPSLLAAISLLERSPKTAAPSNKMFDQMLADYRASALIASRALQDSTSQGVVPSEPVVASNGQGEV